MWRASAVRFARPPTSVTHHSKENNGMLTSSGSRDVDRRDLAAMASMTASLIMGSVHDGAPKIFCSSRVATLVEIRDDALTTP